MLVMVKSHITSRVHALAFLHSTIEYGVVGIIKTEFTLVMLSHEPGGIGWALVLYALLVADP